MSRDHDFWVAMALLLTALLLSSCRPGRTAAMPPVLVAGSGPGRSFAVGPFTGLRATGWVKTGLAWGWGDLGQSRQVFFTLAEGGRGRAVDIPLADQMAVAVPLPDGSGCVGVHYKDFTVWLHPFEGEARRLGKAEGVLLSPSGRRILVLDAAEGTAAFDTETWARTDQPAIPSLEFPYAGLGVDWIDDSLVSVRLYEPDGGPAGTGTLRLVRQPEGSIVGKMVSAGDVLSPFPSPDGRWLAVLAITGETALYQADAVYPFDAGRELRLYAREALEEAAGPTADSGYDPVPAAIFRAGEGSRITDVVWSPDGTWLAYAETAVVSDGAGGLAYESVGSVVAARAGRFAAQVLALPADPGAGWVPVGFSATGKRLLVAHPSGQGGGVWTLASGTLAPLPSDLNLVFPAWLGDDVLCATLETGMGPGRPVLVRAATGTEVDPGWPEAPWWSAAGDRIVLKAQADPGGTLPPFGKVGGGEWLAVFAAPES